MRLLTHHTHLDAFLALRCSGPRDSLDSILFGVRVVSLFSVVAGDLVYHTALLYVYVAVVSHYHSSTLPCTCVYE